MPRQYSPEFRQRALRLLDTMMEASEISEFEAIKSVASKLGMSEESVRRWRRKAQFDAGERPGVISSGHAEIRKLKREVAELRRANEVLSQHLRFSQRSSTAPQRNDRLHRCSSRSVRGRAHLSCPAGRYPGLSHLARFIGPRTRAPSDREIGDEQLIADLREVHRRNYSVYGVLKMHQAIKRRGWQLGRQQTHRLMRKAGLRGMQRGKPVFTTVTDLADARPADLVNRQFRACAPNRLWVADITFVRIWQGFCYTAFVTDACTKKIVGWEAAATMRTEDFPLRPFNHAVWQSDSTLSELVHQSDRGSQYLSLAYTDRLAELGIAPSVGSRGDSYDNALAEAVNAAYKTELINRGKPWRCIDDVELSTAEWVAWYNQERLH